jgi:hypothetical protein
MEEEEENSNTMKITARMTIFPPPSRLNSIDLPSIEALCSA